MTTAPPVCSKCLFNWAEVLLMCIGGRPSEKVTVVCTCRATKTGSGAPGAALPLLQPPLSTRQASRWQPAPARQFIGLKGSVHAERLNRMPLLFLASRRRRAACLPS